MNFSEDTIIGLEVHIELNTKSKLFCSCPTQGDESPNSRICPICLGHPGSKPVLNKAAIEKGIKLALAAKCTIAPKLMFSRKSYFYPDMSKNYQITQYEEPLGEDGEIVIEGGKKVGIQRIHLEEDPASLQHLPNFCLVDYNRSGNPLIELVTKPEIYSPDEARAFMKKLKTILKYLDIFDPENGIIKADANVSIKKGNYNRVEIKNITGFKEIERAIDHEVERQHLIAGDGREIIQETRGWNAEQALTVPQRLKETEDDYGYIIDPDLVPIDLDRSWINALQEEVPELAHEKSDRFTKLGVDPIDAKVLAENKDIAELFDDVSKAIDAPLAAKWIRREVMRVLNYNKLSLAESKISAQPIIDMLKLVQNKELTEKVAQKLMEGLVTESFDVKTKVKEESLSSVGDAQELSKFCQEVLDEQPDAVQQFRDGTEKAFNFLVGQVMRKTRGQAAPDVVKRVLEDLIDE